MSQKPDSPARRTRRIPAPAAPCNPPLAAPEVEDAEDPEFVRRVRRAAAEAKALQAEADAAAAASGPEPALPAPTQPEIDAHGFDPADYQWIPVRRKPRKDGWTPQRQQDFIAALAETGCVEHAAIQVDMSPTSCYRLRRSPGGESFAAAWDLALQHASRRLLDVAFDRAFRGTTEPVFDRHGNRVGERCRQNDRLTMFLLRAYMPERFRHAHRDWRAPDEPLPAAPAPMEAVLRRLAPAAPAAPHTAMAPDELEDALFVADTLPPGDLPRWHAGRGDCAPPGLVPDPEFEARLEELKHDP